ncbi:MAG: HU family DNA-binding protein [Prevotella sp.]|nr:HU family DNA-binding protein [Prevotella sp.]
MNNKNFIQELARRTGYTNAETQRMVSSFVSAMGDSFQEGESVVINNLGTFEVKKRLERIIVNPTTHQRLLVPPKLVLGFKPIASIKEKLKKGGKKND